MNNIHTKVNAIKYECKQLHMIGSWDIKLLF